MITNTKRIIESKQIFGEFNGKLFEVSAWVEMSNAGLRTSLAYFEMEGCPAIKEGQYVSNLLNDKQALEQTFLRAQKIRQNFEYQFRIDERNQNFDFSTLFADVVDSDFEAIFAD